MIKTLKDLELNIIKQLKNNNFDDIVNIVEQYNGLDWKKYIDNKKSNGKNYNKKKIDIVDNIFFDMYIVSWNNNKKSKIHNHANNGCIMKVLNGNLMEHIYDIKLNLINSRIINKNDVSFINDNIGYHSIRNIEDVSHTLHIYSPPNHITKYFN